MSAATQVSELLYDLVIDPTLLDLVLAIPDLTWGEFSATVGLLLAWDVLTKPVVGYFWRRTRRPLSRGLFQLAAILDPAAAAVPRVTGSAVAPFTGPV